jgi:hypothetical protein
MTSESAEARCAGREVIAKEGDQRKVEELARNVSGIVATAPIEALQRAG